MHENMQVHILLLSILRNNAKVQLCLQFTKYKINHQASRLTFGFPPKIMSVPLPAIFVEMVIAYFRPACATVSASLAAYWGNNGKLQTGKSYVMIGYKTKILYQQFLST